MGRYSDQRVVGEASRNSADCATAHCFGDSKAGDGPDPHSRRSNRLPKESVPRALRATAPKLSPILLFQKERVV
jgi:hypothetical protein